MMFGQSHPARGAWIEIKNVVVKDIPAVQSHPARGAWIEIVKGIGGRTGAAKSHPARGAWIEIYQSDYTGYVTQVAPRKGCVD